MRQDLVEATGGRTLMLAADQPRIHSGLNGGKARDMSYGWIDHDLVSKDAIVYTSRQYSAKTLPKVHESNQNANNFILEQVAPTEGPR